MVSEKGSQVQKPFFIVFGFNGYEQKTKIALAYKMNELLCQMKTTLIMVRLRIAKEHILEWTLQNRA